MGIVTPGSTDNGGWLRKVLMWDWHELGLRGWPGWAREHGYPPYAQLHFVHGVGRGSHALAAEWDDVAQAGFYYRDWTKSGTPLVRDGDRYWSGFWFATVADRDAFWLRYGSRSLAER